MADKKKSTVETVWEIAEPIAEKLGLILWDVRFVKEGTDWYLRIIIDKAESRVDIDDCVAMSRALDAPLDEADPIDRSYSLQVQSPGVERELTRDFHFASCIGEKVNVRRIHAQDGRREFGGTLRAYENGTITVEQENGETLTVDKKDTSWVKLDDFGGF